MVGPAEFAVQINEVAHADGVHMTGEVLITLMLGAAQSAGWLTGCWWGGGHKRLPSSHSSLP